MNAAGGAARKRLPLVLSNAPYYGHYRIAATFLATAAKVLVPGGRITLVTRAPEWFTEAMPKQSCGLTTRQARSYWVVQATQPSHADGPRACQSPRM